MKMQTSAAALTILGIAACSGVDPTSLRAAQSPRSVSLAAPYTYEEYYRMAGTTMMHTLAPGNYTARFEDDGGTYFDGPEKCFLITARFDTPAIAQQNKAYQPKSFRCGIYVPAKRDEMPRVYFYQEQTDTTADPALATPPVPAPDNATQRQARVGGSAGMALVQAMIVAEQKNLHFNRDQPKDDSPKRALSSP